MYVLDHSCRRQGVLNQTPGTALDEDRGVRRHAKMLRKAATQEVREHGLFIGRQRGEERILDLTNLSRELRAKLTTLVRDLDLDASPIRFVWDTSYQTCTLEPVDTVAHNRCRGKERRRSEEFVRSQRPKVGEPKQRRDVTHGQPVGLESSLAVAFHRSTRGDREASNIVETQGQSPKQVLPTQKHNRQPEDLSFVQPISKGGHAAGS